MKLYFVRHGQTDSNVGMSTGEPYADHDEALNKQGVKQANELAEELKDVKFDALISSPLRRAIQTAEIVNKHHHLPIEIIADLQERKTEAYIDMKTWHDMFDFDKSVENVESLPDFLKRTYDALDDLLSRYKGKTILLTSHGGVQHALYTYAHKLPHEGNVRIDRLENCEYRIYDL
jgi:broad specificity phosphatase PhoE